MNQRTCTLEQCEDKHLAKGYCRRHYRELANPDKPRDRRTLVVCIDCGDSVMKQLGPNSDRERCPSCAWRRGAQAPRNWKRTRFPSCRLHTGQCPKCGKAWSSAHARKFCSTQCSKDYHAEKYARTGECRQCGGQTAKGRWYCDPCGHDRHRATRLAHKKKRQAWKRGRGHLSIGGTPAETVHPHTVHERDQWTCGICAHQINPAHRYPHPMSPSLDHITPLSKGGAHTYSNIQSAHLKCNMLKGDSIAA